MMNKTSECLHINSVEWFDSTEQGCFVLKAIKQGGLSQLWSAYNLIWGPLPKAFTPEEMEKWSQLQYCSSEELNQFFCQDFARYDSIIIWERPSFKTRNRIQLCMLCRLIPKEVDLFRVSVQETMSDNENTVDWHKYAVFVSHDEREERAKEWATFLNYDSISRIYRADQDRVFLYSDDFLDEWILAHTARMTNTGPKKLTYVAGGIMGWAEEIGYFETVETVLRLAEEGRITLMQSKNYVPDEKQLLINGVDVWHDKYVDVVSCSTVAKDYDYEWLNSSNPWESYILTKKEIISV